MENFVTRKTPSNTQKDQAPKDTIVRTRTKEIISIYPFLSIGCIVGILLSPCLAATKSDNHTDAGEDYERLFNPALPSVISMEIGFDNLGTRESQFDLELAMLGNTRLLFGLGRSGISFAGSPQSASRYNFGISSEPLEKISFDMHYFFEILNSNPLLESENLTTSLNLRHGNWLFGILPEIRTVFLRRPALDYRVGIRNLGAGLGVDYYGFGKLSLYTNVRMYRNITILEVRNLLTSRVAQEFDRLRATLALDYDLSWGSIAYQWQKSVSTFDQNTYTVNTFTLTWDLSHHWTLYSRAGWSPNGFLEKVRFVNSGLAYSW